MSFAAKTMNVDASVTVMSSINIKQCHVLQIQRIFIFCDITSYMTKDKSPVN